MVPLLPCSALAQADPDESVEAGRQTLDRWWGYPWYDASTDGVRRIDVSPPRNLNWNWPNWNLSWLGPVFRWVAWIAVVAVLAVLVYLLVRAYLDRGGVRGSTTAADDEAEAAERRRRIESLPFPVRAAQYDLLAEARRHYRQGNYGEAVKYLFSHQLVEMDKHKIIRLTRGKTNRQYLGEVGRRTTLRRMVEQTMVAFEDFFFGDHAIDRGRFEACWSRLDQFEALVTEGAA